MSSTEPTAPREYRSGPGTQDAAAGSVPPAAGRSTGYTSHRYGDPPPARTWWDVIIGGILVGTGVVVLGDVAVASVVSVIFLGWTLVIGGVVGMVVSFFLIGRGGFWIGMLGGLLALVVGMVFLRHPGSTLVAFSLAIGAVLLISGVTRLIAAVQHREARGALVVSGVLSLVLGLLIFAEWPSSTLWLVGALLGIQLIVDGLALIFVGRPWRSRV